VPRHCGQIGLTIPSFLLLIIISNANAAYRLESITYTPHCALSNKRETEIQTEQLTMATSNLNPI